MIGNPTGRKIDESVSGDEDGDANEPANNDLKGVRILVVDDDPDTREAFTFMLKSFIAEVQTAGNVAQGLDRLSTFKPSILISDIAMPKEDGFSLIKKVRSLPKKKGGKIAATALTAFAGQEERKRILDAGFQAHLPKPIDADRLVATIAKLTATD